ncbi:MAG TPA: contact-dependent growth inhibition system immunity protein [Terriglobales bacterium]|nr:contact-dependent growth inhibition system immunity protein [Terriglobales bacterium]
MSHSPNRGNLDSISPAAFPALRNFLRGYLHQDMADESGSVAKAVRQFCEDAAPDERRLVADEWARFLTQTRGWSLEAINRALTERLGSSSLLEETDLETVSSTFREFARP